MTAHARYLAGPGRALPALWLLCVCGACLAAETLPGDAVPAAAGASGAKRAPEETRVELERLAPPAAAKGKHKSGNAFGSTSWYVPPPPPPPPKPQPPPPPTAPPMPFSFLGQYEEAKGRVILLVKGDQVYTVKVGDVIENTYRLDRADHGTVDMTYLPLNIKQSINTGNAL